MAIRLRKVDGLRVALCAAETDEQTGDLYLDDADHYALAAKFARDFGGSFGLSDRLPVYREQWAGMDTQKVRDAGEELRRWLTGQEAIRG